MPTDIYYYNFLKDWFVCFSLLSLLSLLCFHSFAVFLGLQVLEGKDKVGQSWILVSRVFTFQLFLSLTTLNTQQNIRSSFYFHAVGNRGTRKEGK